MADLYYKDASYSYISDSLETKLLILLPGGCYWAKSEKGGCTMCGFQQAVDEFTGGKKISDDEIWAIFESAPIGDPEIRNVTIFTGGSFTELAPAIQEKIFERLGRQNHIREVYIETRPELVKMEKMKILLGLLDKSQTLKVGIGLEAQDDRIREVLINKGFTKQQYEEAFNILKGLQIRILTYIFLKPPGLSEKQALEEAILTAQYAFGLGTDEIAIESALVQPGTTMHEDYKKGNFSPPWLWTIIELIQKIQRLGPLHLGGFMDEPQPIAIPSNCGQCSNSVREALERFRQTYNPAELKGLDCACKHVWRRKISQ